jgi:chemotaxis protein methyltransferase WspC
MVNYKQGNITIGAICPKPAYYDIIYCRNLLIYFDRDLQKTTLEKIYRSLKPGGLLYVGPAESAHIDGACFSRYGDNNAFGFRRIEKTQKITMNTILNKDNQKINTHWSNVFDQLNKLNSTMQLKPVDGRENIPSENFPLTYVEKLILNGDFEKAERYVKRSIENDKEHAVYYYLLAQIKYRTEEVDLAESLLKKAAYLDSNHEKTIQLLREIALKKGDTILATSYQRRLNRIKKIG